MIALVLCSVLAVADGPQPPQLQPQLPEMPTSVEDALGVEHATPWKKIGLAGTVTGGALVVLAASSFTLGLDSERALRAQVHTREEADSLLLRRGVFAAIGWPSLVLGAVGLGAGATLLVLDDSGAL